LASPRFSIRHLVLIVILGISAALVAVVVQRVGQRRVEPTIRQGPKQLMIKGLSRRASLGGGLTYSLTAEQLVQGKRKFGPLTLNPAREIVLTGVRIELDLPLLAPSPTSGDFDLRPVLDDLTEHHELGIISRIVLRRLTLVCRRGEAHVSLVAKKLVLGADGVPSLEGQFSLESFTGDRLEANAASWNPAKNRIRISGPYFLRDEQGAHGGRDSAFRVGPDGRIRPLQP
jgi:hypothetical protein